MSKCNILLSTLTRGGRKKQKENKGNKFTPILLYQTKHPYSEFSPVSG
jgi:hypothetical protein